MNIKDRIRFERKGQHTRWWIDLTDIFQKLIGDIVVKAEATDFYDYSEEDIIECAEAVIDEYEKQVEHSEVCFDNKGVLLTFVNGRTLDLYLSGWLDIMWSKD